MTRVLLLYDAAAGAGDEASRDVFDQLDAIEAVLRASDARAERFGVGLDLAALKSAIGAFCPDAVFNLVESVDGSDRLQVLVPLVLEDWGVAFTGCGSAAMLLANDKIACKISLGERGFPVPEGVWPSDDGRFVQFPDGAGNRAPGDWIIKAATMHASLHLDDASVLRGAQAATAAERARREGERHGAAFFAERFVPGREFNISLLQTPGGGVETLPPAEIDFSGLPPERERIVGYAAKWDEAAVEYAGTVRRFDFPPEDGSLLAELRELSERVWRELGLAGYARVDFRVDEGGRPFILEVNANPCLTPGAGFAAAAERGGMAFGALVDRILREGTRACKR